MEQASAGLLNKMWGGRHPLSADENIEALRDLCT